MREMRITLFNLREDALRPLDRFPVLLLEPGFHYLRRRVVTVMALEELSVLRVHPVAMEISVGADVHLDHETHKRILERPSHLLPTLAPSSEVLVEYVLELPQPRTLQSTWNPATEPKLSPNLLPVPMVPRSTK